MEKVFIRGLSAASHNRHNNTNIFKKKNQKSAVISHWRKSGLLTDEMRKIN